MYSVSGTAPLPDEWWKSFEDAALDALIEEGLGDLIKDHDRELVLREPHLQEAQQTLAAAEAALAKARLDVERCKIRMPFNAVIKIKYADIGARASPTSPLSIWQTNNRIDFLEIILSHLIKRRY